MTTLSIVFACLILNPFQKVIIIQQLFWVSDFLLAFLILLKCVCFTIWLSNPNYQLI